MRDKIYDHGKYAHEEGFRTHTFVPAGFAICVDPLRLYNQGHLCLKILMGLDLQHKGFQVSYRQIYNGVIMNNTCTIKFGEFVMGGISRITTVWWRRQLVVCIIEG